MRASSAQCGIPAAGARAAAGLHARGAIGRRRSGRAAAFRPRARQGVGTRPAPAARGEARGRGFHLERNRLLQHARHGSSAGAALVRGTRDRLFVNQ
jgi:hypothetical protein